MEEVNEGERKQEEEKEKEQVSQKNENRTRFVNFVNNVLALRKSSTVESFDMHFDYVKEYEPVITQWVRYVFARGVEKLNLELNAEVEFLRGDSSVRGAYILPKETYSVGTLTELTLLCCRVAPQSKVFWNSLRSLTLTATFIKERGIRFILMGSPCLESLVFVNCRGFGVINTWHAKSLRNLEIHGFAYGGPHILEVSAPGVESLILSGDFGLSTEFVKCRLKRISSLKSVTLDFEGEANRAHKEGYVYGKHQLMLLRLIKQLVHVDQLRLGHWCIKVLSISKMMGIPCPTSNWNSLKLESSLHGWEIHGIHALVEASPKLNTLLIDTTHISEVQFNFKEVYEDCEEKLERDTFKYDMELSFPRYFYQNLKLEKIESLMSVKIEHLKPLLLQDLKSLEIVYSKNELFEIEAAKKFTKLLSNVSPSQIKMICNAEVN